MEGRPLVAAGEAYFSLGSDTGGSVRQPASLCGVVGLKPTYGLVSRYGLIAFASSLDQIGPLTRDIRDCALVMDVIAGHDPRDSTSVPRGKENYTEYLGRDVRGFKVALPRDYFEAGIEAGVKKPFWSHGKMFTSRGREGGLHAHVICSPPIISFLRRRRPPTWPGMTECSGYRRGQDLLSLYIKIRNEGFGPEVKGVLCWELIL